MNWHSRPVLWSLRNRDLTLLDFSFWIKDIVYKAHVRNLTILREPITDVIATVMPNIFRSTLLEINFRPDMCRATNGAHIGGRGDLLR